MRRVRTIFLSKFQEACEVLLVDGVRDKDGQLVWNPKAPPARIDGIFDPTYSAILHGLVRLGVLEKVRPQESAYWMQFLVENWPDTKFRRGFKWSLYRVKDEAKVRELGRRPPASLAEWRGFLRAPSALEGAPSPLSSHEGLGEDGEDVRRDVDSRMHEAVKTLFEVSREVRDPAEMLIAARELIDRALVLISYGRLERKK